MIFSSRRMKITMRRMNNYMNRYDYPSIYDHIDTYEKVVNVLECIAAELKNGSLDADINRAIDYIFTAKLILFEYEGTIVLDSED